MKMTQEWLPHASDSHVLFALRMCSELWPPMESLFDYTSIVNNSQGGNRHILVLQGYASAHSIHFNGLAYYRFNFRIDKKCYVIPSPSSGNRGKYDITLYNSRYQYNEYAAI